MARDISRFRIPQRNQPSYESPFEGEGDLLPPEVARYLRVARRRPYIIRGLIAGALIALGGLFLIYESRRRRTEPDELSGPVVPAQIA